MKIENWIEKLDKDYKEISSTVYNPNFLYYPHLKFVLLSENITLRFRKISLIKTQFIFEDEFSRKFYFTDVDLIDFLINCSEKVFLKFYYAFEEFIYLNENEKVEVLSKKVTFLIDDEECVYYKFCEFSNCVNDLSFEDTYYECKAGFKIDYRDIMSLINLILHKEFLAESSEHKFQRVDRQIKKFFILSSYYRCNLFKDNLLNISYDIDKPLNEVYNNNKIAKEIDPRFDNVVLDKLKL
ncbi:hypothetical protein LPB41_11315 [Thalassospira sp. MA62]|nr:hypothetical protein [Thalassospira sp. MA62]